MTPLQALQLHQQLCDELHELALEENRFLQQHQRTPDPSLIERKRALSTRLDETLAALRSTAGTDADRLALRQALDKARSRVLQILQLDKENEQLLLRFSLSSVRPSASQAPAVPPTMLQKIYERHR